jgi:hypothetical protein
MRGRIPHRRSQCPFVGPVQTHRLRLPHSRHQAYDQSCYSQQQCAPAALVPSCHSAYSPRCMQRAARPTHRRVRRVTDCAHTATDRATGSQRHRCARTLWLRRDHYCGLESAQGDEQAVTSMKVRRSEARIGWLITNVGTHSYPDSHALEIYLQLGKALLYRSRALG